MKYLVELMDKETVVYESYLSLAIKKKQALIDNDLNLLDEITLEEKALSTKILALEAARTEFLREQGFDNKNKLDEILPKLENGDRESVEQSASRLKTALGQCKTYSDQNMSLLRQSSNYINHMIRIFTNTLNGGQVTYNKKGSQNFKSGTIADMQG
jgi:Zn-dependent M16 (insulinase) family peptidase